MGIARVTSAVLKSAPAAALKDSGSIQATAGADAATGHARRRQGRSQGKQARRETVPPGAPSPMRSWAYDCVIYFIFAGTYKHETIAPPGTPANLAHDRRGSPAQKAKRSGGDCMFGLMQDWPLLCHRIIDHAAKFHGERKVITRSIEGPIVRPIMPNARSRAESCAAAGEGRHQIGRPGGDARLEHLASFGAGAASSALARSITPSTRGCSPNRSSGSSISPGTGC